MYTPRFFASKFWVCLRVLGLFRTFHAHTTMLNARPTIFCFRALGLFVSFWVCFRILGLSRSFHAHTTMLNAHPPIFFLSFGFVCEFWVCFEHPTHTPRCSTPAPRFFVSEFWLCCRVLSLYQTFHAHTTMLNVHSRSAIIFFIFFIPVLLNERFSENHNYWTRRGTDFVHSLFSSSVNSVDAIFLYIYIFFGCLTGFIRKFFFCRIRTAVPIILKTCFGAGFRWVSTWIGDRRSAACTTKRWEGGHFSETVGLGIDSVKWPTVSAQVFRSFPVPSCKCDRA